MVGISISGLGIYVLVDLSPRGGNLMMIFSKLYGDQASPSLLRTGVFLVIGGLVIIADTILSMMALCRNYFKMTCGVSSRGEGQLAQSGWDMGRVEIAR